MNRTRTFAVVTLATAALAAAVGSLTFAEPAKEPAAPAAVPEMKLPPGWTEADMQACMVAGQPGEMHQLLAKDVGVWRGKTTMWMAPDAEPIRGECTVNVTAVMDGRYISSDVTGQTPGMGEYRGLSLHGYDNVAGTFVSTSIDSQSTGIMRGTGEMSADHKTLTWNYTYSCPVTKKPAVMRDVETRTGENAKTIEMFATEPKSGKEFRMMRIELTRE